MSDDKQAWLAELGFKPPAEGAAAGGAQPVAAPPQQPQGQAAQPAQPAAPDLNLGNRLQAAQRAIAEVRQALGKTIYQLGPETAMDDLARSVDSWVNRQRAVPGVQNDQEADQTLQRLATLTASVKALVDRYKDRIQSTHQLYLDHGALKGVPAARSMWQPLLGNSPPDETALLASFKAIDAGFGAALPGGFDDLDDGGKAKRFVDLWKLGAVRTDPATGVGDIYVSSFDGPKDQFGVSWNLKGLAGWVLHGHAKLQWDDRLENVTAFDTPRIHIKPEAAAGAKGGTIEIADAGVIADLNGSSLKHVQRLAKNRHYAEIFARTKFKKRS
jgi:hypothetical protein